MVPPVKPFSWGIKHSWGGGTFMLESNIHDRGRCNFVHIKCYVWHLYTYLDNGTLKTMRRRRSGGRRGEEETQRFVHRQRTKNIL